MSKMKCWKKSNRDISPKPKAVFEHVDGERLLWITDAKYVPGKPIRVGGVNKRGYIKDEFFKNEKEALLFAEKYMKEHDRC